MNNTAIQSLAEYEAALARISALMDAESETAEAEELNVLALLVEAYEAKHWPIDPPTPEEAARFRREQESRKTKI